MMERTLYINESHRLSIKRDGPSLWIEDHLKRGRRIPARLLDQVIIKGGVTIDSGVFELLSDYGVPVTFLNKKGEIVATIVSAHTGSHLKEEVYRFSRIARNRERVITWLEANNINFKTSLLRRLVPESINSIYYYGPRKTDYEEYLHTVLSNFNRSVISMVRAAITSLIHEFVLTRVLAAGLSPHTGFVHRWDEFGFVKDICFVLEAERDRQLIQCLKNLKEKPVDSIVDRQGLSVDTMKDIIIRFENHKKRLKAIVDGLLEDFVRMVRSVA